MFLNLAWAVYYFVRVETGWIKYANPVQFLVPLVVIYLYWIVIFSFTGLYQYWFVRSRFDEFASVIKSVSIGCFILFFLIFIDDTINNAPIISRFLILIYWILVILFVGAGRIIIRGFQRNLLQKGIGLRNTLIIGEGEKSSNLSEMVTKFPQLGYKIIGFISLGKNSDVKYINSIEKISETIKKREISEVLIALEPGEKERLVDVIKFCTGNDVHLMIMPDMYEIVSGMARTNQIYGVPLIEVMPEIMPPGSKLFKRIVDIVLSGLILILYSPLLLISIILIKLTSKGPVFYKQERVGRNEKVFTMYKFRSMVQNAEEYGPEWAGEDDPRITGIGKILRKMYIDEIPQVINVLKNEMSIVGPRPERPYFVTKLKNEIPYYYKRLSVKPGITGWAQIKHKYDSSLEDVKEKLQYDFYYIENMSLKLDFKIMINTIIVVLLMKGH
ncbi:MAG: sugar transferase [Ignavibacteria bacterium]|nr:sugar transferase [Ignavibacteria bacterium]